MRIPFVIREISTLQGVRKHTCQLTRLSSVANSTPSQYVSQWKITQYVTIFTQENASGNILHKTAAILSSPHYGDMKYLQEFGAPQIGCDQNKTKISGTNNIVIILDTAFSKNERENYFFI